jgi:UDP-N-acetylglucosamine 2-epimerase (hydrolysing)
MRFEFFLTLLKESKSIVGNSSAGVREAPYYGVPTVNIGSRQQNRAEGPQIFNVAPVSAQITQGIEFALKSTREVAYKFGRGNAANKFIEILISDEIWPIGTDKVFIDVEN